MAAPYQEANPVSTARDSKKAASVKGSSTKRSRRDELIEGVARLRQVMADELIECARSPSIKYQSQLEESPPEIQERMHRCVAFGQYVSRPEIDNQFGLYGTAAAIEVLASSDQAKQLLASTEWGEIDQEWLSCLLRTWNFLDLVISGKFIAGPIDQTRCTLRICNMLRAVAAARPVLQKVIAMFLPQIDEPLAKDLGLNSSPDPAKHLGLILYDKLLKARIPEKQKRVASKPATSNVYTFRYGTDSPQTPNTTRDWLFMWGSVLVAVERASLAGILDKPQVDGIVQVDDLNHIRNAIEGNALCDDMRFSAFVLWALDQFRQSAPGLSILPETSLLRIWVRQIEIDRWLRPQIINTCRTLLRVGDFKDVEQSYERQLTSRPGDFQDHFVIPVFPILIDLLARHTRRKLFAPRIYGDLRRLIHQTEVRMPSDNSIPALLYQNNTWNGTVNCLYFGEAGLSASRALKSRHALMLWLAYRSWGWITGQTRTVYILMLLGIGLIVTCTLAFYALFTTPTEQGNLYFWTLGIATSVVANLATGLALPFLRRILHIGEGE